MTLFILLYFIAILLQIAIRAPFAMRSRRRAKSEQRVSRKENILLSLMTLASLVLPVVYSVTGWLSFADYHLPGWLGWAGAGILAFSPRRANMTFYQKVQLGKTPPPPIQADLQRGDGSILGIGLGGFHRPEAGFFDSPPAGHSGAHLAFGCGQHWAESMYWPCTGAGVLVKASHGGNPLRRYM